MPIKLLPWSIWKFCSASKRPYILLIGTGAQKIKWKSMVFYQTPLRLTPHQQCWQQWQVFFPAKKFSPYFSFRNMTTNEWNKFYSWIQLFDNGLLLPEILALWATFKAVLRAVDMLEFSRSFMVFDHQRPPPSIWKKITFPLDLFVHPSLMRVVASDISRPKLARTESKIINQTPETHKIPPLLLSVKIVLSFFDNLSTEGMIIFSIWIYLEKRFFTF